MNNILLSVNGARWLGRLAGHDDVDSIDRASVSWGAPWAASHPEWIALGCALLAGLALWFYFRRQGRVRPLLAVLRGLTLCLLFLILAEPTLTLHSTLHPKPLLWLLFDGTESMAIQDELPIEERQRLADAVGLSSSDAADDRPTRQQYVQALLQRPSDNLIERLQERFRLKAFVLDRADGVRPLEWNPAAGPSDSDAAETLPSALAAQLTAEGGVTALGAGFSDLVRRHAGSNVAGVVVFSDFDQNAGPAPLGAARRLGAPIFAVGVGPESAQDLAVDLSSPPLMKKAERSGITATLRQTGLDDQTVTVRLLARKLGGETDAAPLVLGTQQTTLRGPTTLVDFPFTPEDAGRFVLSAEVEPLPGEIVSDNNRAEREVSVRDDFLRLMFVEYEPTWEWRFIKEVFHRDKLVGERGFRTFLRSSDPKVRQTNELFLETAVPPRADFFATDVIFLGDMPAAALNPRFCEMTKEFVSTFGGGLVILSGPRFGPGPLADTALADMLPVVVDPDTRLRDRQPFALQLTPEAAQYDFMRLEEAESSSQAGWRNMGDLPWYQPVSRLHPLATALAVHPEETCVDGRTPQPLIAVRRYGRGEVVYLGFNETWRLRRLHGERYYRQFWGQMIHRLGLSHAPGAQKRFVVRVDRQQFQPDEQALVSVEAYDVDFEPLDVDKLPQRRLEGEHLVPPTAAGEQPPPQAITIAETRPGLFELRLPLFAPGEHLVRVKDPVTNEPQEVRFQVASVSAERRSAVRNAALQHELALATGGKSYELENAQRLAEEIDLPRRTEQRVDVTLLAFHPWLVWPCFLLLAALLLVEWFFRKVASLP